MAFYSIIKNGPNIACVCFVFLHLALRPIVCLEWNECILFLYHFLFVNKLQLFFLSHCIASPFVKVPACKHHIYQYLNTV